MKKLFLAVAVSTMAAGSVNAATIYEKDGLVYKLNGDFLRFSCERKLATTPVSMSILMIWN